MDGFERRTEKKKENIRDAAMKLFQTHGFGKVSINDIAREAGVSHVTIYNHFHSKEDLIRDVLQTVVRQLADKSREIIESDIPYLEKINQLIFNKANVAVQYQGQLMKMISRDLPEMRQFMEEIREKVSNELAIKLVDEGKRLKYIKKDLSPESIKLYFMILRNGVYNDPEMLESLKIDSKLAHDLNYLWLYGLIEKQD